MLFKLKIIVLVCTCIIFLNACVVYSHKTNVPKDNEQWGEYRYNKKYRLSADVFLLKVHSNSEYEHMALAPEKNLLHRGLYSTPNSTKEYIENNGDVKYNSDVVGIVNSGIIIKMIEIKKLSFFSIWYGSTKSIYPYAIIQSGKYKDVIVDISDISIFL